MRGEQLRGMTARLRALSHVETLRRGFAIVRGPSGRVIHLAAHAEAWGDFAGSVFPTVMYLPR